MFLAAALLVLVPRVEAVPDLVVVDTPERDAPDRVPFDAAVDESVPRDLVSVAERPFDATDAPELTTVRPSPMMPLLTDPLLLEPRTTS